MNGFPFLTEHNFAFVKMHLHKGLPKTLERVGTNSCFKTVFKMKNSLFVLAFMLMGTFAFANTTDLAFDKGIAIENLTSANTASVASFDGEDMCGFTISWDTAEHGTGSFWFECDGGTTMDDILNLILALFF
jgi:hypothetical protein